MNPFALMTAIAVSIPGIGEPMVYRAQGGIGLNVSGVFSPHAQADDMALGIVMQVTIPTAAIVDEDGRAVKAQGGDLIIIRDEQYTVTGAPLVDAGGATKMIVTKDQ